MNETTFDLLIVGAGPAGSATALAALAADPSARVALVDRAGFPPDRACGDGMANFGVGPFDATTRPTRDELTRPLAGDAAGLVDPLTGEGVHTALLSGMLAGHAAVTAHRPLVAYRRTLRLRLGRRLAYLRLAVRAYHRHPGLLDALIATAGDRPAAAHATAAAMGDDALRMWTTIATAVLTGGPADPPDTIPAMPGLEKEPSWER